MLHSAKRSTNSQGNIHALPKASKNTKDHHLHQPILIFQTHKTIFTNPSAPHANGRPSPLRNPSTPPAVPPGFLAPPSLECPAVAPSSARSSWPRPPEELKPPRRSAETLGGFRSPRGSVSGDRDRSSGDCLRGSNSVTIVRRSVSTQKWRLKYRPVICWESF